MVIALIGLIILILLFGAAAVKGWIKGAFAVAVGGVVILIGIGFIASHYNRWKDGREHQALLKDAIPLILQDVSQKASVPESRLVDVVSYDQGSELYLCGSIEGTTNYGGPSGRRRFLSNGGNTELEMIRGSASFDDRQALHCTNNPDAATMR